MPGSPIRTPWDHSLVDSSPRPIAASHVLHRLLVPRHPPSALSNLTTKMLASTVQFSNNTQPRTSHPPPAPIPNTEDLTTVWWTSAACPEKTNPVGVCSLRTQQDAASIARTHPTAFHTHTTSHGVVLTGPGQSPRSSASVSAIEHLTGTSGPCRLPLSPPAVVGLLLRKDLIQPHLPVRLPCYDFVPIASPTFDHSLPQGVRPWASGVADFRDVTGGVYKARERIHRSVADLRLLATPTSRGRVADPDPN